MNAINTQYTPFLKYMDSLTFVGSDSTFRAYRYNTNHEQTAMQIVDQPGDLS